MHRGVWESQPSPSPQTCEPRWDRAARWPAVPCSVPSEEPVLCLGSDEAFTMVVVMAGGGGGAGVCSLRAACGLSLKVYFLEA